MNQETNLTKLVMGLLFGAIVIYIIAAAIVRATDPISTVTAYAATTDDAISVSGWVVREETRLPQAAGLINLALDEGEKVAAGKNVAVVYEDQDALSRQQELGQITAQLAQLQYARDDNSLSGTPLEEQVSDTLISLRTAASTGDYAALAELGDTYKRLILRREFLSTSDATAVNAADAAMGQAELRLEEARTALNAAAQGEYTVVTAPAAGVYSSHTDGYEARLLPAQLAEMGPTAFAQLVQQPAEEVGENTLGKVVTSLRWRLAFLVAQDRASLFREGATVEVRFSALTSTVEMTVERISLPEADQCLITLASSRDLSSVLSLRNVTCSVVFDTQEGILIPKEGLRVLEGEDLPRIYREQGTVTGVYAVTAYKAEFKPVTVLAEGEDYYLVAAAPRDDTDKRILRSGDEVILAATDLYDGKVVR